MRKVSKKCCWLCGVGAITLVYVMHWNYGILDTDQSRCDTNLGKQANIRYLINLVTPILEKHNVTYWLDYGTALGAYRYCDVIRFDYDGDISYLASDYDKLERSLDEIRRLPGVTVSSDIVDIHYRGARVDVRGWRKVRKWSLTAWYHQLTGDHENPQDYYLYQIVENRPDYVVSVRNQLYDKIQYSFLNKRRRKVRFGASCAYVMDDLVAYVKARYPYTYQVQIQTKQRCLGKFSIPPVCGDYQCK